MSLSLSHQPKPMSNTLGFCGTVQKGTIVLTCHRFLHNYKNNVGAVQWRSRESASVVAKRLLVRFPCLCGVSYLNVNSYGDDVGDRCVPIQLFHLRYDTDIAALSIGRYRYQSDTISAGIIQTFITYFVVWTVRKGLIRSDYSNREQ